MRPSLLRNPALPRARAPVLALLLGACAESSSSSDPVFAPALVNVGLVARSTELAADGDLVLIGARESEGGGRDLNQDGDTLDLVLFVLDLASGTARNTALALEASAPTLLAVVRGDLALFAVSERASGERDWNGDGDASDTVAFVHDARDHSTRGLGLALTLAAGVAPALGGELAAFLVSEAAQGQDLDGDGSARGDVLHVYDAALRVTQNTALDLRSPLFVEEGSVAWFAGESSGDRNGDGDTFDLAVLQVLDVATGQSHDSRLATDGAAPTFAAGAWMVAVPEAGQGRDLDGDGLRASSVAHVFEPASGRAHNLGLACVDVPCALPVRPAGIPAQFALRVAESDGIDRNGDCDLLDSVLHLYDPAADRLRSTRVAALTPPVLAGGTLGFLGPARDAESMARSGEPLEPVAFATDAATAVTTALGQEAIDLRASAGFLLLARRESVAGEDWNLDGDMADVIVHAYAVDTGTTTNTRLASVDVLGASAEQLLLYVDERGQRADLNGDRDQEDQVFVLFELADERAVSLGLAGGLDGSHFGCVSATGRLAFLANERAQGRDLDGDGDLLDDVLHRGR